MQYGLQFFVSLLFSVVLATSYSAEVSPKVLIYYSSIGMGHLSAARAIEKNLKEKDPKTIVQLVDIRTYSNPVEDYVHEKIYWWLVKNKPDTFDGFFRSFMEKGNAVPSLTQLKQYYNKEKLYRDIISFGPTAIIATHYGSAQALGDLREMGRIHNIPIGWLHTDYFQGYFPRLSKRVDMTFVGMPLLKNLWEEQNVNPERVISTGMPINPKVFTPINRTEFLKSQKLDPNIKTIVLASGGEGVGDYPLIVEKIVKDVGGPIQIVAICANNKEHFKNLSQMKGTLPKDIVLDIRKMIPNEELLNLIKSSDLFITKSGGLSPTEGFAINKPIILLDVYGGHERDNAKIFEDEKFAVVNRDQSQIGQDVKRVFADQELQREMFRNQLSFRNSFNLGAITNFVFNARSYLPEVNYRLGLEWGETVVNAEESLNQLEKDSPVDVEILLAYAISTDKKYFKGDPNPFGHLAIRIKDTVYTANGRAILGNEPQLIHKSSLQDYLYGVDRPYQNVGHTDAFGSAYGRNNISVRVSGVDPAKIQKMLEEVQLIDDEWRRGETRWHHIDNNCADIVVRLLRAGGFRSEYDTSFDKKRHLTMPLDVLHHYTKLFESDASLRTEIASYTAVANSQNIYKTAGFPLSIYQLKRSLRHLLKTTPDEIELKTGKRIAVYPNSNRTHYENVNGKSATKEQKTVAQATAEQAQKWEEVISLEKQLEGMQADFEKSQFSVLFLQETVENAISKGNQEAAKRAISKWNIYQKKIQATLDDLTQKQTDFYIQGTLSAMQEIYTRKEVAKLAALKSMREMLNQATQLSETYKGQAKDSPLRSNTIRDFFTVAKGYFDLVNGNFELSGFWNRLAQKSKGIYLFIKGLVKASPNLVKTAITGLFRPLVNNPSSAISESVVVDNLKIQLNVRGKEQLLNSAKSKKITIITPLQSHPVFDSIIMSQLQQIGSLAVVTNDQPSVKEILQNLQAKKTNNILLYPQGSVLSGSSETQDKFTLGLIKELRQMGFEVEITPLTYQGSGSFTNGIETFMQNLDKIEKQNLEVVIGAPISSKMIDFMIAAVGDESIIRFIRAYSLENSSKKLFGTQNTAGMAASLNKMLNYSVVKMPVSCQSLFAR